MHADQSCQTWIGRYYCSYLQLLYSDWNKANEELLKAAQ